MAIRHRSRDSIRRIADCKSQLRGEKRGAVARRPLFFSSACHPAVQGVHYIVLHKEFERHSPACESICRNGLLHSLGCRADAGLAIRLEKPRPASCDYAAANPPADVSRAFHLNEIRPLGVSSTGWISTLLRPPPGRLRRLRTLIRERTLAFRLLARIRADRILDGQLHSQRVRTPHICKRRP